MMIRKWLVGVLTVLMVAGCAAPQPTRPQVVPTTAAAAPTATRARTVRPTPTPQATPAATASPSVASSATATTEPTMTPSPSPTTLPANAAVQPAPRTGVASSAASGVLLSLDRRKYPTPVQLAPDNNATYHVSQPVVHFAWSATPTDLMTFGQMPGCVSDATNFRRAFESYQLVIHSLDTPRADQVQWMDNGTVFDLNLTTVPAGRYSWSVNVVTLCESYVVGQRNDLPQHKSTLQRAYLAPASPTSATRSINWVP